MSKFLGGNYSGGGTGLDDLLTLLRGSLSRGVGSQLGNNMLGYGRGAAANSQFVGPRQGVLPDMGYSRGGNPQPYGDIVRVAPRDADTGTSFRTGNTYIAPRDPDAVATPRFGGGAAGSEPSIFNIQGAYNNKVANTGTPAAVTGLAVPPVNPRLGLGVRNAEGGYNSKYDVYDATDTTAANKAYNDYQNKYSIPVSDLPANSPFRGDTYNPAGKWDDWYTLFPSLRRSGGSNTSAGSGVTGVSDWMNKGYGVGRTPQY